VKEPNEFKFTEIEVKWDITTPWSGLMRSQWRCMWSHWVEHTFWSYHDDHGEQQQWQLLTIQWKQDFKD